MGEHTGVHPGFVFMTYVLLLAVGAAGVLPAYLLKWYGLDAPIRRGSTA